MSEVVEKFFLSILASSFASIKQNKSDNAILLCIEESLKRKVVNRIDVENAILKNEKNIKGEPRVYYSLRKYKKRDLMIF